MASICFYFQIHQPFRLKSKYSFFEIGNNHLYEDTHLNETIFNKVSNNCYIPATKLILDLVEKFKGKFKVSYSISGAALEQFQQFKPEALDLFKRLHQTGCAEFIAETYYHSLSFLYSLQEFREQVEKHRRAITELFGESPVTFRNTELVYSNAIALEAKNMGFENILAEGAGNILKQLSLSGRTYIAHSFPYKLYCPKGMEDMNLLLRNYKFSDDIAFRFSEKMWKEYPLTARKYTKWLCDALSGASAGETPEAGFGSEGNGENKREIINLFMDYETLGEHHSAETGILKFFEEFITTVVNKTDIEFIMPKEASQKHKQAGEIDVPHNNSWADEERDISAWAGNSMQKSALNLIYKLEENVKKLDDKDITHIWRKLQISDHFYYMATKGFADGDVHKYFNYFVTPYDAYIVYCNVVNDLREAIKNRY